MATLSAPNNNSAVTLLNATNPSIGKYCNTKGNFEIINKFTDRNNSQDSIS